MAEQFRKHEPFETHFKLGKQIHYEVFAKFKFKLPFICKQFLTQS